MQKIFVIGDIHGCFDKLCALMNKIPINFTQDQLIFIGDYIDRGSGSLEVVDYLIDLKKRVPELTCIVDLNMLPFHARYWHWVDSF